RAPRFGPRSSRGQALPTGGGHLVAGDTAKAGKLFLETLRRWRWRNGLALLRRSGKGRSRRRHLLLVLLGLLLLAIAALFLAGHVPPLLCVFDANPRRWNVSLARQRALGKFREHNKKPREGERGFAWGVHISAG